ncbi:unnamed protein product [Sympodiomycopsis kandeliae]
MMPTLHPNASPGERRRFLNNGSVAHCPSPPSQRTMNPIGSHISHANNNAAHNAAIRSVVTTGLGIAFHQAAANPTTALHTAAVQQVAELSIAERLQRFGQLDINNKPMPQQQAPVDNTDATIVDTRRNSGNSGNSGDTDTRTGLVTIGDTGSGSGTITTPPSSDNASYSGSDRQRSPLIEDGQDDTHQVAGKRVYEISPFDEKLSKCKMPSVEEMRRWEEDAKMNELTSKCAHSVTKGLFSPFMYQSPPATPPRTPAPRTPEPPMAVRQFHGPRGQQSKKDADEGKETQAKGKAKRSTDINGSVIDHGHKGDEEEDDDDAFFLSDSRDSDSNDDQGAASAAAKSRGGKDVRKAGKGDEDTTAAALLPMARAPPAPKSFKPGQTAETPSPPPRKGSGHSADSLELDSEEEREKEAARLEAHVYKLHVDKMMALKAKQALREHLQQAQEDDTEQSQYQGDSSQEETILVGRQVNNAGNAVRGSARHDAVQNGAEAARASAPAPVNPWHGEHGHLFVPRHRPVEEGNEGRVALQHNEHYVHHREAPAVPANQYHHYAVHNDDEYHHGYHYAAPPHGGRPPRARFGWQRVGPSRRHVHYTQHYARNNFNYHHARDNFNHHHTHNNFNNNGGFVDPSEAPGFWFSTNGWFARGAE